MSRKFLITPQQMPRLRDLQLGTTPTPPHHNIVIHELDHVCDSVTGRVMTGSWLWDSALVLSDYISTRVHNDHSDDDHDDGFGFGFFSLHGKTVLELGAGVGLPGLTASRLGALKVILTDLAPILPVLWNNVRANGMDEDDGRVEVCELVWGSDELPSQLSGLEGGVDLVLMSDLFYDPALMGPLAKTLKMMCRGDTVIWSASEFRQSTTECVHELANHGFEVTEFPSQHGSGRSSESCSSNSTNEFVVYIIRPPN